MYYELTENSEIKIFDTSQFDAKHIFDCGQVFRYRNEGDCHTVYSKDKICLLQKSDGCVIIKTDDTEYFIDYFDLKRDYSPIKKALSGYDGMKDALEFGSGIRILNQDAFETVISFIVSANNNIPRIKGILERICQGLGDKKDGYYAFPTPEQMASADEKFFSSIGAGYRARYLAETAKALCGDFRLNALRSENTAALRKKLTTLLGVGGKVADCIMLFAYHRTDLFPMDTWSKKIYSALGFPPEKIPDKMSAALVEKFGVLAGYAQQYLYYYYRSKE